MDTAIQAANERMVYVTGDKEAIWQYERRQIALSDHTSEINYARGEGYKEGLNEGTIRRTIEIAQKMKAAGRPLTEIADFTGLSQEAVEQIK